MKRTGYYCELLVLQKVIRCIQILVSFKELVNAKNKEDKSQLEAAWEKGSVEVTRLIEHGADIHLKDDTGNNLLHRTKNLDLLKCML